MRLGSAAIGMSFVLGLALAAEAGSIADRDGDLVPVVTVNGQVLTPVNGNRYCYTATVAGTFTVLITAEDGSGNIREEDFRIIVTESLAPQPTNLLCNYNVNATLDENCQRFITPDMVLEGSFGCLTEDDFVVTIVNDDDPTNGNILDGCGALWRHVGDACRRSADDVALAGLGDSVL